MDIVGFRVLDVTPLSAEDQGPSENQAIACSVVVDTVNVVVELCCYVVLVLAVSCCRR